METASRGEFNLTDENWQSIAWVFDYILNNTYCIMPDVKNHITVTNVKPRVK